MMTGKIFCFYDKEDFFFSLKSFFSKKATASLKWILFSFYFPQIKFESYRKMQSYRHKVRNTQEYFTNVICQSEKSEMKALQIFLTEKKRIGWYIFHPCHSDLDFKREILLSFSKAVQMSQWIGSISLPKYFKIR